MSKAKSECLRCGRQVCLTNSGFLYKHKASDGLYCPGSQEYLVYQRLMIDGENLMDAFKKAFDVDAVQAIVSDFVKAGQAIAKGFHDAMKALPPGFFDTITMAITYLTHKKGIEDDTE